MRSFVSRQIRRLVGLWWALCFAPSAWAVPLVVIDPGHGGSQEGALGPQGLLEKDLALSLAKKVKEELEASAELTVLLTREKDSLIHLSDRVAWANRKRPEVFVSIHANSMATEKQRRLNQGIETYFLSASASGEEAKRVAAQENAEAQQSKAAAGGTLAVILADLQRNEAHVDSSRLAYFVHHELVSQTGAEDRGVQQAPFFVLMGLEAPAVLVEVGFVSHPTEGLRLRSEEYQKTLAKALANGVRRFLSEQDARDARR